MYDPSHVQPTTNFGQQPTYDPNVIPTTMPLQPVYGPGPTPTGPSTVSVTATTTPTTGGVVVVNAQKQDQSHQETLATIMLLGGFFCSCLWLVSLGWLSSPYKSVRQIATASIVLFGIGACLCCCVCLLIGAGIITVLLLGAFGILQGLFG